MMRDEEDGLELSLREPLPAEAILVPLRANWPDLIARTHLTQVYDSDISMG
jgi:hypothetical protein